MLFDTFTFFVFLLLVFLAYWGLPSRFERGRNAILLASSYFFYGWWDYRFLSLIVLSSLIDFCVALAIFGTGHHRKRLRKALLGLSVATNLGLLGVFKYFNFFVSQFAELLTQVGLNPNLPFLKVALPVGISFYTFQTLSYTIDVYRREMEPTRSVLSFFAYVSFFPQLVAGPIERARNLLPQFSFPRKFDRAKATQGLILVLWGLFKKIVVADSCGTIANEVFGAYETMDSSSLVLGVIYFAFQIYGDFSGYSDIALGVAALFGFSLMRNFAYPYFSRDIAEFWRRWHISLSTWFRDYLYIPLGGSRVGPFRSVSNVLTVFVVSGLWHGANWTFLAWGALNGIYFIPLLLSGTNRQNLGIVADGRLLPNWKEAFAMSLTFSLTCLAWVFFRASSVDEAVSYLTRMLSMNTLNLPSAHLLSSLPAVAALVTFEWIRRKESNPLYFPGAPRWLQWSSLYVVLGLVIFFYGTRARAQFIYFQF
jgi:D-alanyl-lipoteichoic acid acyltransferase DltB (MBOAT superfamily)